MSFPAAICAYLDSERERMECDEELECYADCISLAIGHLKQAYELTDNDIASAPSLLLGGESMKDENTLTKAADEEKAECLKKEGNALLAAKKYQEAIEKYDAAIKIMPKSAIFWSNKAACYLALEYWDKAIESAKMSIRNDAEYAKGHGRLAAALKGKGEDDASLDSYMKALSLDPSNSIYQKTIDQLKTSVRSPKQKSSSPMNGGGFGGGMPGGMDFSSLMSNPELMKMANEMMSNPEAMKSMMNNPQIGEMMKNMMGGAGAGIDGVTDSPTEAVVEEEGELEN